jgi:hypothetical protein
VCFVVHSSQDHLRIGTHDLDHPIYASTFRRVSFSTLSHAVASSRQSASQAQPGGGPSKRSQIRTVGHLSFELHISTFWNLATNLFTTSTWAVLPGEHRLHGRGHHSLKCGKLLGHLSMSEGRVSHPLR